MDQKAKELASQGIVRIGDVAPDFTTDSSEGKIQWHQFIEGGWAILMSHPRDFTPVCTTEISAAAKLAPEWEKRKTKVAVVSVDSAEEHKRWVADINKYGGHPVNFPILDDKDKKISLLYGMLNQDHLADTGLPLTVRSVYFIGPDKKVKLILTYPAAVGRNFDEIIRCLDALQLSANKLIATPANWKQGDEVCIQPQVTDEQAATMFTNIRPVFPSCKLRMTSDPAATTNIVA